MEGFDQDKKIFFPDGTPKKSLIRLNSSPHLFLCSIRQIAEHEVCR
jgi:hypothetical protein